ncbi:MAG: hypothetical protein MZW92_78295 [Comamonadaceae bacterium]|nr:hypothetical protein [Comamonadaceae bacterium]
MRWASMADSSLARSASASSRWRAQFALGRASGARASAAPPAADLVQVALRSGRSARR